MLAIVPLKTNLKMLIEGTSPVSTCRGFLGTFEESSVTYAFCIDISLVLELVFTDSIPQAVFFSCFQKKTKSRTKR